MPLSSSQKQFILNAFNVLLEDLPADSAEFAKAEEAIAQAITGPENKGSEFYLLRECLLNPTRYYAKLEKQQESSSHLTIGEVQLFIINEVTAALEAAAKRANTTLLHWDRGELVENLQQNENFNTQFESEEIALDNFYYPLELENDEDCIYLKTLTFDEDNNLFRLSIDFKPAYGSIPGIKMLHEITADVNDDDEEDAYIEEALQWAEEAGSDVAFSCTLGALRRILRFNAERFLKASLNRAATKLITHSYYYDLLRSGSMRIDECVTVTEEQSANLMNKNIVILLRNNILTRDQAKNLTAAEMMIATHPTYLTLLLNREITIADIKNINDEKSRFLILPFIANLIMQRKLNFNTAKNFPIYLKNIFQSDLYIDYLNRGPVNWEALSSVQENRYKLLLIPEVAKLIKNGKINFTTLSHLPEHEVIENLALRLCAIFRGMPYNFNERDDDVANVLTDTFSAVGNHGELLPLVREIILARFIKTLTLDLRERTRNPGPLSILYISLLNHINLAERNETPLVRLLGELIHQTAAFGIRNKKCLPCFIKNNFFTRKKTHNEFKSFNQQLKRLTNFSSFSLSCNVAPALR